MKLLKLRAAKTHCPVRTNRFMALLGGLCLLSFGGAIAQAQSSQQANDTFVYNPPAPPPGQGTPMGRQKGGASRGSCKDYTGLTALVPESYGLVKGLTTVAEPTFLFYVPVALNPKTKVELVVQDQDDEYITRRTLALDTDSAGIVPIKLTQPRKPLKVGETYQWTLSIYCDPTRPSASISVQGLLGRASETAFTAAATQPSFEQAAQYAEQGIWFDSLTLLAQLRQADPRNLKAVQAWYDLLQQAELGSVAPAKLLVPENQRAFSKL